MCDFYTPLLVTGTPAVTAAAAAADLAESNLRRLARARPRPRRCSLSFRLLQQVAHFYCPQTGLVVRAVPTLEALGFKGFGSASWSLAESACVGVAAVYLERSSALPSLRLLFIPVVSDSPTLMKGHVKATLIL